MIYIRNLKKSFQKKPVINDFHLTINKGIYGLLGPNGAGKTTLLRCIMSLHTYEGTIDIDRNVKIGYLPQKFNMFKEQTVKDTLEYFAILKQIPKSEVTNCISHTLEKVNLTEFANKKMGELSGGMVRRVGIAQSILDDPEILIIDEPTSGLDPEERMRFKLLLTSLQKEKTIIISTHITDDIDALCQYVIIMDKGLNKGMYTLSELKNVAQKRVVVIPSSNSQNIDGEVIKTFEKNGIQYARVICKEPQNENIDTPTVEDGYLCVIRENL